jgi:hypothetical protein
MQMGVSGAPTGLRWSICRENVCDVWRTVLRGLGRPVLLLV